MYKTSSKQGSFQITDDGFVQVVPLFAKQPLWREAISSLTSVSVKKGMVMCTLVVTGERDHVVDSLGKQDIDKISALLPLPVEELKELPAHLPKSSGIFTAWYEDERKLTHVATYDNDKAFAKELEKAYQHGWQIQGQSSQAGKSSAGKVIGGALLLGPVGALAGAASKSKGKTTVTYVRTPEWMAQHRS